MRDTAGSEAQPVQETRATRHRKVETLTLETQHANVRYEAQTRFLDATTDPEPLWRLARPPDDVITRSPGRADLRRSVWAVGSVFVYADVEPLQHGPQVPVAVIDLGAGGARLEAKTEIPLGADFEHVLEFPLPFPHGDVSAEIRILDGRIMERMGQQRHQYRARFVRLDAKIAGQIVRYVNELEAADREAAAPSDPESPFDRSRALALLAPGADVQVEPTASADTGGVAMGIVRVLHPDSVTVELTSNDVAVESGQPVTLLVHDPTSHANVVAQAEVTRVDHDGTPVVDLRLPSEFRQRAGRSHARWPTEIQNSTVVAVDASSRPPIRIAEAATVVNLGAGGAAFHTLATLPVGPQSAHHLRFLLPGAPRPIAARVRIIARRRRPEAGGAGFIYRCEFIAMTRTERDQITREVLRLQAEHRRAQLELVPA